MSDTPNTPPSDRLPSTGVNTIDETATPQGPLRCQWCSVPLADGITVCPTCGSPGIPDPKMTVPGLTDPEEIGPDPLAEAAVEHAIAGGEAELVEWWRNETSAVTATGERRETLTYEEVEQRRMQSLMFIGVAILVCTVLGWLIGPMLLETPFERLTGTTVEDLADLRTMGTISGLIGGMFVGATGGWVIWSNK